ncbi:MAG TPA: HAD family hydrolase [Roseiflexaceae bacterium]
MTIRAVFFDVGETLVDETRQWGAWADWLGIPRLTCFAALGAVIERGEHHRRVFELLRPGLDLAREHAARLAAGLADRIELGDFYPDALPCLRVLRARGYRIGLAGNQPVQAEEQLRAIGLPVDVVASSDGWGVEKPSPAFFARVVETAGVPPPAIAYVGDRLDNDVIPAAESGMVAVFLRRGPWGYLHATRPEVKRAAIRLDSLAELPEALDRYDPSQRSSRG